MLRAEGIMVRSHYLLLLFLLALQVENAQSAPTPGQGAGQDREASPIAPQADSMMIPSWYLKRKDYQRIPVVPEGLLRALVKDASETDHKIMEKKMSPMGEISSVLGSDEETEGVLDTRTPAQQARNSGRSAAAQKAETPGQWEFSQKYFLASAAVSALLLLAAVVGYIVMYQLLKRNMMIQGDKEASTESNSYSFWDTKDYS